MSATFALIVFAAATVVSIVVAWFDLKTMTIPNWLTVGAGVFFLALVMIGLGPEAALYRLAGVAVVLAVCICLFFGGVMGGGDAKAAPAFAALIAPADASFVLMALAINGLIGLIVIQTLRRTRLADGSWQVWRERQKFPYGLTLAMTLTLYTGLVAYMSI